MNPILRAAVLATIVKLWPGAGGSLESSAVYQQLRAEGVAVPDGTMSTIFQDLQLSDLINGVTYPQRPATVDGAMTITWVLPALLPQQES